MTLLIETPRKKKISVESLIEKLYHTQEKSEIINGEIIMNSMSRIYSETEPLKYLHQPLQI